MKNLFTFLLVLFLIPNLFAQFQHFDYGTDLVIHMNENIPFDVNGDGFVDFQLNSVDGHLGLTPIFFKSCVVGTGDNTNYFTPEIQLFNEGDFIQMGGEDGIEIFNYIEGDDLSVFTNTAGNVFADGWADQEDRYIGFALIDLGSTVINGWMKLSVDVTAQTLIIKEIGYNESPLNTPVGIHAGQTEALNTSVAQLETLTDVSVSPNPANNFTKVTFDYAGNENLSVSILNNIGQEVRRVNYDNLSNNFDIDTSDWTAGIYFIHFETKEGSFLKKLSVAR